MLKRLFTRLGTEGRPHPRRNEMNCMGRTVGQKRRHTREVKVRSVSTFSGACGAMVTTMGPALALKGGPACDPVFAKARTARASTGGRHTAIFFSQVSTTVRYAGCPFSHGRVCR